MLVSLHNLTAVVLLHIVILWQGDIISIILTSCKTTLLFLPMVLMVCGLFNFVWSTDWVRINLVDLFLDWILKGLLYNSPIENKDNIYYWSVPNELVLYSYYMRCENKRSVKMNVPRKRMNFSVTCQIIIDCVTFHTMKCITYLRLVQSYDVLVIQILIVFRYMICLEL